MISDNELFPHVRCGSRPSGHNRGIGRRCRPTPAAPHIEDVRRRLLPKHTCQETMRGKLEIRAHTHVVTRPILADDALMRREHTLRNEAHHEPVNRSTLLDCVMADPIMGRQCTTGGRRFQIAEESLYVFDWMLTSGYIATLGIIPAIDTPHHDPAFRVPET